MFIKKWTTIVCPILNIISSQKMLESTFKVNNNLIKIIHLIYFKIDNRPTLIKINVRENPRDNQEWTIQRSWKHLVHKTQDEDKQNKQKTQHRKLKTLTTRTSSKTGVNGEQFLLLKKVSAYHTCKFILLAWGLHFGFKMCSGWATFWQRHVFPKGSFPRSTYDFHNFRIYAKIAITLSYPYL